MKAGPVPIEALEHDLRKQAESVGLEWAERWFDQAQREQRALVGGWPGTMSEARAHVVRAVVPWLRERGRWPAADVTNFEATARVVYATARAAWRQRSAVDPAFPQRLSL